ncbi:MAG: prepilin-type N-terminal cleavage/methylation domain-containing protein [Proteobacteria bacterium]|nr:prepilin-type N-terminal cleavage/methylation domain-containing protein [Pseudomonadota bacterium]
MKSSSTWKRPGKFSSRGYTLIEVLVGMTIFALGMLALVHLQGNLARNSGDSNSRTVANNIAEEVIESFRTFSQIPTDPGGVADAFEDIATGNEVIEVGGISYEVDILVTKYYSSQTGTFDTTNSETASYADMKLVELTVTWNSGQGFRIDETSPTSLLGSGSITLTDIISSITSPSGGKVSLMSPEDNGYAPIVDYNPGANPDIISIQLGDNKFKESTTPLPDVIRSDEMVETRFDVVTYSQDNAGATFLRREEFRAVSCECTLRVANAEGEGGLRPTIWDGVEYSQAEFVAKPWGESAINLQSSFCSLCCRDHHDGGTGEDDVAGDPGRSRYDAFRSSENYYDSGLLQGDHKHYKRNNQGELTLADSDGDVYVEACRLVRKDGFFRVAQDLRQEGLNNFPASYLDDDTEVAEYSAYVTAAVTQYEADVGTTDLYELNPPDLTAAANMPTPLVFPASTFATASVMESGGVTEQQLRTRGIYLDYMSDDLRTKINCLDLGGDGDSCEVPSVTTALEIIPFYDVQLTWLARWNESPINDPVDVTNETIQDDNAHSRGIASLQSGFGFSTVSAAAHKGNLGLTATDPTDPEYAADVENKFLYVLANDPSTPPVLTDIIVTGTISSAISGLRASDVEISATNAQCDRTNTGYVCILEVSATTPIIQFSNYSKANRLLVACSDVLVYQGQLEGSNGWTKFRLPNVSTPFAEIVIKDEVDCQR